MRRFWLLAAVVAAVVIWRVGEAHRTACIQAGKLNCSVLPWSGSVPGSGGGGDGGGDGGGGGTLQGVSSSVHGVGGSVGGSISGSGHSVP